MLTLAFDTSSRPLAVALLNNDAVVYDTVLNTGLYHSETLLPAIDQACKYMKMKIDDVDLFSCTLGPGSFTGLRVGVSTMKGLLMATEKPGTGVSALAALALNIKHDKALICPVMDASRGQVYIAGYKYNADGSLQQVYPERIVNPAAIMPEDWRETIFVGDGAVKYRDVLTEKFGSTALASGLHQYVRASAVGILGREKYMRNELLDPASFVPFYLRAAEAKPGKKLFE